ncbi:MAG: SAM-dependent methyltransferase [Planctomycetes bacterium GWF2_41_51]|nr:MAG: SAM-dependent methyltransferase [Planctomycetes bacterium GWF2_41_51]HBG27357.1 SAM-dependent methyltransferase [Phycisphaerales bacterium]
MPQCRICKSSYEPFISFGQMPIANGFIRPEEFSKEYFFELATGFCSKCNMVQLIDQPNRDMMFHENYAFFSSTSAYMQQHFKEFAELIMNEIGQKANPFVMEIGSNDGIMLQNFAKAKIRHLGIEPSANVAKIAFDNGVNTISEFFDENLARKIMAEYGQADAITAANVMCHIPTIHSVVEGFRILLKPNGIIMFEDPYLGDIVENTLYDQIYDEHVFLFSVASIGYLFGEHGLEIVDVMPQITHGGSMRYVIAHKGAGKISQRVIEQREKEKRLGLHLPETYVQFRKNIENSRDRLVELLTSIKKQGKRVVGYAATSKSTTINNYCGITAELVEYISDTTPIKHGKFSPGTHIPVKPYKDFCDNYPDYALLYAYNHAREIMAKEQKFMAAGGKWITYVPKVGVLG